MKVKAEKPTVHRTKFFRVRAKLKKGAKLNMFSLPTLTNNSFIIIQRPGPNQDFLDMEYSGSLLRVNYFSGESKNDNG